MSSTLSPMFVAHSQASGLSAQLYIFILGLHQVTWIVRQGDQVQLIWWILVTDPCRF